MFSATFPDSIRVLASDFLNNYIFVTIGRVGSATDLVTQSLKYVEEEDKKEELLKLLKNVDGRTLIFAATKKLTDHLGKYLLSMGFSTSSIHGNRTQMERENALKDFKSNRCRILVATDVAARGLHIDNVTHVINFDLPTNIQDYVHRIGRTGRCGKQGLATSFFNRGNTNVVHDLVKILKDNKQTVPEWLYNFSQDTRRGGSSKMRGGKVSSKDWRKSNFVPNNSYGNFQGGFNQYGPRADWFSQGNNNF